MITLLQILNLFADLFDLALDIHDLVCQYGVVHLGADGVRLTVHLLHDKIELSADGFAGIEEALHLVEVGKSPPR